VKQNLTILVNSTDSFEDCWDPFFKLFSTYWAACPYPIVLNVETKMYAFPGLDLRMSQVGKQGIDAAAGLIPWSDCLLRCLEQIETETILYLQDDYFIHGYVDQILIDEFLAIMTKYDVSHIRLMETDKKAVHRPSPLHPLLWEISHSANYRISMQAALWRLDSLKSYLRSGESGWQFERLGSQRAYKRADLFLCQSLDEFNAKGRYPIPYKPTGIIKGKWYADAVVDLFKQHGIVVDYQRRGFYQFDRKRKIIIGLRAWARRLYMWIKWWFSRHRIL
jgi:hypothetical protein